MNAGNRILWIAFGVLLSAIGVVGTLASLGRLPGVDSGRLLIAPADADRWRGWDGWAFGVTIAAGLIVALLGFLLLRAQLRGRGGADLPDLVREPHPSSVDSSTVTGRTHVASSALSHALTRDLQADRQVRRAAVRLVGAHQRPELLVRLAVTADADLGRLHDHVDAALSRFAATSGLRPHLREVSVRIADEQPARVS
jgi:hypothetical protein